MSQGNPKKIKHEGRQNKPRPVSGVRENNQDNAADLEAQLSAVVEQDGVTISVAPYPRRPKQKIAVNFSSPESAPVFFAREETPVRNSFVDDPVRHLDLLLIHRESGFKPQRPARKLDIRFQPHEASGYVLKVEGEARRVNTEMREAFGTTIPRWYAPFEAPPDPVLFLYGTSDLHIDEVDPSLFIEQFTPGDPDTAYSLRYHWWSKWRSPFIRWEQASGDDREKFIDEQFTPGDPRQAYKSQYGLSARLKNWWRETGEDSVASLGVLEEIENPEEQADLERIISSAGSAEPVEASDYIASTSDQAEAPAVDDIFIDVMPMAESVEASPSGEEESWQVPVLVPKLNIARVLAGFLVFAFLVSVPAIAVTVVHSVRGSVAQVTNDSKAALEDVRAAVSNPDVLQPQAWSQASSRFQSAQRSLSNVNSLALAVANAIPQTRSLYQSANALLQAGDKSAQAASLLSQGLQSALAQSARHPDERLLTLGVYLDSASPLLDDAVSSFSQVAVDRLPADLRPRVEALKTALATGQSTIRDLRVLNSLLISAVGHDSQRDYLFIFQNNTELRPTGGFMGSLAEVTLDRGDIKRVVVPGGGPYDLRSQLLARVAPPAPLQLVGPRWEFQDANWFPDFPTSANKIRWFWDKSRQPTLDGVIAVNATFMQKLLAVTGPIDMPDYGKTINADNFLLETQKAVELDYDKKENKPKKFIGDLMAKVMERIKQSSPSEYMSYLTLAADALETKDIQVAFSNPDEEQLAESFGWSGRIKPAVGDALAVVEANIAGQKTDGVINEHVRHDAVINADGTIVDTVTLTRTHTGQTGELFRGANNVEYVRLYVPVGAELLSADGFDPPAENLFERPSSTEMLDPDLAALVKQEPVGNVANVDIMEESGRTVFGGWIQLEPGQTSVTHFSYRLPFTASDLARKLSHDGFEATPTQMAYLLQLESQSGKPNRDIETHLTVPVSWQKSWSLPQTALKTMEDSGYSGTWDRDQVIAELFDNSNGQRTASR